MLTNHYKRWALVLTALTNTNLGCQRSLPMHMQEPTGSMQKNVTDQLISQAEKLTLTEKQEEPTFAVVFLHGLTGMADELNYYQTKVAHRFKKAIILAPRVREELKSALNSMETQADSVYQYIQDQLIKQGKDPKSFPLVIFGYSQGGNIACLLSANYRTKLSIAGLYTVNAPLNGVAIDWENTDELQKWHNDISPIVNYIGSPANSMFNSYKPLLTTCNIIESDDSKDSVILSRILGSNNSMLQLFALRGIKDLKKESEAIQSINSFLRKGADNIPCRLVGSYLMDWQKLCTQLPSHLQRTTLDIAGHTAKYITKKYIGKHDMLVPLRSQLGRGDSFNDLTILGEDAIENLFGRSNVSAKVYRNIVHAPKLIVIDRSVNANKTALGSQDIADDFLAYAAKWVGSYTPSVFHAPKKSHHIEEELD